MPGTPLRRFALVALVGLLLIGAGATMVGGVQADGETSDDDTVKIASQDIVLSDATVTISDVDASGPGLPDEHIEHRTYTIDDATFTIDGLNVQWDGKTYNFCHVEITVDDVGVTLENVTLEDTS